jgi:hypothetical protein
VRRAQNSADLNLLIAVLAQVAYRVSICAQADEGKPALVVRHIGGTDIKEACAVCQLDNGEDMRTHADFLVEVGSLSGLRDGDAPTT